MKFTVHTVRKHQYAAIHKPDCYTLERYEHIAPYCTLENFSTREEAKLKDSLDIKEVKICSKCKPFF